MDLPVYLLDISEDMNDDAEVDYVALVDKPAIDCATEWQDTFSAYVDLGSLNQVGNQCINHVL